MAHDRTSCAAHLSPIEEWAQVSTWNFKNSMGGPSFGLRLNLRRPPHTEVAHVVVDLTSTTLLVRSLFIEESHRGQKLSHWLMAKLLSLFPYTNELSATLTLDNAKAFDSEYRKTGDVEMGYKNTPFYKSAKKLGFTRIHPTRSLYFDGVGEFGLIHLTLGRP